MTRQDLRNRRPDFRCAPLAPVNKPRVSPWPAIIAVMLAITTAVAILAYLARHFLGV